MGFRAENDPPNDNPPEPSAKLKSVQTMSVGIFGSLMHWWMQKRHARALDIKASRSALDETVTIAEVTALVHFVVDHGIDPEAEITGPLNDAVNEFINENDIKKKAESQTKVLKHYSQLTGLTYPTLGVNGRSVLSTNSVLWDLGVIIAFGFTFFALAAMTQILTTWYEQITPPTMGFQRILYALHQYGMVYLYPFFWGGLGACIYLAKGMSDRLRASSFDSRKLRGQSSRIFLGAILAAVVVNLFFEKVNELSGFKSIGPGGVAFLTGLGVRAVYGAFEKAVALVDNAIQGLGARPAPPATPPQPASPPVPPRP